MKNYMEFLILFEGYLKLNYTVHVIREYIFESSISEIIKIH